MLTNSRKATAKDGEHWAKVLKEALELNKNNTKNNYQKAEESFLLARHKVESENSQLSLLNVGESHEKISVLA